MKYLTHLRPTFRYLILALVLVFPPLSGQSSQIRPISFEVPGLMVQLRQAVQTRLAVAFPPPLKHSRHHRDEETPYLRLFAVLQVILLSSVAIWWRLRLGHWGLR